MINADSIHPIISTKIINDDENLVAMKIEAKRPIEKVAQKSAVMYASLL